MTKLEHTGSATLMGTMQFIRRFVFLAEPQAIAITLWVAHTHAMDAAVATPYLSISSAEKQCGKSRLLEVLNLLVAKPWFTGSTTKSALVRKMDADRPTLLLDESDAAFNGDKEYAEALRGVLNSGHSRSGTVSMTVLSGGTYTTREYGVFGAKAIAGIGKLPDTVADRSIPIRMKRRSPGDVIARFRRRLVEPEASEIRTQLSEWIGHSLRTLEDATPELPEILSDRQQDGCEPLLAIADLAGGEWPAFGRGALCELFTGQHAADDSVGVSLLDDIRTVFNDCGAEKMFTQDLLSALYAVDERWTEHSFGKPISGAVLSRLLKPYEVSSRKIRIGDLTLAGYWRDHFKDAWSRYLPRHLEQTAQCASDAAFEEPTFIEKVEQIVDTGTLIAPTDSRCVPPVPNSPRDADPRYAPCPIHGRKMKRFESPLGSGNWLCDKCHPEGNSPDAKDMDFTK